MISMQRVAFFAPKIPGGVGGTPGASPQLRALPEEGGERGARFLLVLKRGFYETVRKCEKTHAINLPHGMMVTTHQW